MTIAVLADERSKKEWLNKGIPKTVEVLWCGSVKTLVATVADAYFDLLYTLDSERNGHLKMRAGHPFFINAVEYSTQKTGNEFIRINSWSGFLQRPIVEVSIGDTRQEAVVRNVFDQLGWRFQLAPDIPGMITARVIATIINEAYYTYGEKISSKDEIDIAMKLGTSYPLGPFEWSEQIGLERIGALLNELSLTDNRYLLAPELEKELASRQNRNPVIGNK